VPDASAATPESSLSIPAVRVSGDLAIALPGSGRRVQPGGEGTAAFDVVAFDSPRGLALLRVAPAKVDAVPRTAKLDALPGAPGYAAAIEATRNGPSIRPIYFGRMDRIHDPRWSGEVVRLSGLQQALPAGAAVFTLDSRFIGLGFPDDRDFLVVPADTLVAEAERLRRDGSVAAADIGVEVQRLDADLRAATGTTDGVVVTYVSPKGPSAGQLAPADVVRSIGGQLLQSPADFNAVLMQLPASAPVTIERVRNGSTTTVTVTPGTRTSVAAQAATDLGLDLRAVTGAGSEVVRVTPRSAAARAGIAAGDLISGIADVDAPDPRGVARLFDRAPAGARILVRLERGSVHLVVALAKP
jgi:hypothetical protein